jgi:hypothetical protein
MGGNALSRVLLPSSTGDESAYRRSLLMRYLGFLAGFRLLSPAVLALTGVVRGVKELPPRDRFKVAQNIVSLLHATLVTAWGVWRIEDHGAVRHDDGSSSGGGDDDDDAGVQSNRVLMTFIAAYLTNDAWETRAEWIKGWAFMLHHVLGLGLSLGVILSRVAAPLIPRFGTRGPCVCV